MVEEIGGSSQPNKMRAGFVLLMIIMSSILLLGYLGVIAYNRSVVEKHITHLTYETTIDSVTYEIVCYVHSR
jgi:Tfp pilus assembly protein PilX